MKAEVQQKKTKQGKTNYYVKGDQLVSARTPLVGCSTIAKYAVLDNPRNLLIWAAENALRTGNVMEFENLQSQAMNLGSNVHEEIDEYTSTNAKPISPSGLFKAWHKSMSRHSIDWWGSDPA